jgi:uncharacterized membrane protein YedE/YeeE
MKQLFTAFLSGALFALGLARAGMTDTRKVVGFLDFAGGWDPALLAVMAGAIGVFSMTFWLSRRLRGPLLGTSFPSLPSRGMDARLILGAVLFGAGWGLAGYCPGPVIVSLAAGTPQALVFFLAMMSGFWLTRRIDERLKRGPS